MLCLVKVKVSVTRMELYATCVWYVKTGDELIRDICAPLYIAPSLKC